jgi:hypothetical protein
MPSEEEKKTIDIDTSGPGAEVELQEEKKEDIIEQPEEKNNETKTEQNVQDNNQPDDSSTKSDEQPVVSETKDDGSDKQPSQGKEHEDYSEGVKKRIAKLTRKMREAERQRDEALSFAERTKKERDTLTSRVSKLDTGYASEMENRIKSSLAAAQSKLKTARENNDIKSEVEASTSISQLGYEQAKLAELKTRQEMESKAREEEAKNPKKPQMPANNPETDPKATEWASKNTWFGSDSAMTYTAFDLHRKLTEEEGYDPQSDDYYSEIDKRIKLEFPHKFGKIKETTSKPTQTVASATRSPKTGRKSVKLTSSQVAIAKKLGVPLEEYAKQLMNTKEA